MSGPDDCGGQMVPLRFNLAKAEYAVEWLPKSDKEYRRVRQRWTDFVRGSKLLTPAQRQVGLAIADVHINRQPNHRWFNWAWPSHQTLADETGLTRRTVVSAIKRLEQLGLLMVSHGGGAKGRGGRTHRYTLRMTNINRLELHADQLGLGKDVKNLRTLDNCQTAETHKSREIFDEKVRNSRRKDVKELRPTLQEITKDPFTGASTPTAVGERKGPGNESKKLVHAVTSRDHSNLAACVGNGDLQAGFERLQRMPEDDVNSFALRLRNDSSIADSIRHEVSARFVGTR